jgi:hypothetical protein
MFLLWDRVQLHHNSTVCGWSEDVVSVLRGLRPSVVTVHRHVTLCHVAVTLAIQSQFIPTAWSQNTVYQFSSSDLIIGVVQYNITNKLLTDKINRPIVSEASQWSTD